MPPGRLRRKRKGKPLDRSCAHKTVPKQRKLSGRKPAIAEPTSVRRQEAGAEIIFPECKSEELLFSRRFAAKRMNAWDELYL